MVVRPEVARALNKEQKDEVASLEERIDKYLCNEWDGDTKPDIIIRGEMPQLKVQREIINKYSEAGWANMNFKCLAEPQGSPLHYSISMEYKR